MTSVRPEPLPSNALLQRYAADGGYADCFSTELARPVPHAEFVEAFYCTRPFKLERWVIRLAASKPSTDAEAAQLARGERSDFAAWSVEAREPDQLLLRDMTGRTRSWLMVGRPAEGASSGTRLYFGSAVVPRRDPTTGRASMGPGFHALLGFHNWYSRTLLGAAARRLCP